jgi:hypothetical protein
MTIHCYFAPLADAYYVSNLDFSNLDRSYES